MKKRITYRHLDNDSTMDVVLTITEEDGHYVSRVEPAAGAPESFRAPTFYGKTADQAERMMRKVLEKEYEAAAEVVLEG